MIGEPVPINPTERVCRTTRGRVVLFSPARVRIDYDAIECRFHPRLRWLLGSDVVHSGRTVVMIKSRLLPPFWNHLLELVGEAGERVYVTPNWGWKSQDLLDITARGYTISYASRWLL
jgi:hypothetical protein